MCPQYCEDPNFIQPFTFTGREYDIEAGLYHYRARTYNSKLGIFMQEDPIGFKAGDVNLFRYVGNSPLSLVDPWGLLVSAVYDRNTGIVTVTDIDTGQSASMPAESGGKPWGAPIPFGPYEILDQSRNPNSFRLDPLDNTPRNDTDDATGRNHFRLHERGSGNTTGCIAATNDDDWKKVRDLIRNTKTTTVQDNAKPWWKFWGGQEYIKKYGTLVVQ